jgi:1-acyl-sn-glycerol-3-phosphate acyltransferase
MVHPTMMEWARKVVEQLRLKVTFTGTPHHGTCLLVGNHVSYIDIPLLMSLTPVVFVAKRQLAGWPIIGAACKSVGTLFVDRDSRESRAKVADQIGAQLTGSGQSLVIFPSGTTSDREAKPWKWGAFQIARRHGIPVQPFRIRYEPMRRAAYLTEDTLATHLLEVLRRGEMKATVEFHSTVKITDPEGDAAKWWEWSREGLGPL